MAVVPMDSNNTPLQYYDMNMLEYTVIDDAYANRTAIEKAQDYVGKGLLVDYLKFRFLIWNEKNIIILEIKIIRFRNSFSHTTGDSINR